MNIVKTDTGASEPASFPKETQTTKAKGWDSVKLHDRRRSSRVLFARWNWRHLPYLHNAKYIQKKKQSDLKWCYWYFKWGTFFRTYLHLEFYSFHLQPRKHIYASCRTADHILSLLGRQNTHGMEVILKGFGLATYLTNTKINDYLNHIRYFTSTDVGQLQNQLSFLILWRGCNPIIPVKCFYL